MKNKFKRALSMFLALMVVISFVPMTKIDASTAFNRATNITYTYSDNVNVGEIRYVAQENSKGKTFSKYFYSDYWKDGYANYGCFVASTSMALSYMGINMTPKTMSAKGLIVSGENDLAYSSTVASTATSYSGIEITSIFSSGKVTSFAVLDKAIIDFQNGDGMYSPPIVWTGAWGWVNGEYELIGTHYFLVTKKNSDGTYEMVDPISEDNKKVNLVSYATSIVYGNGGTAKGQFCDMVQYKRITPIDPYAKSCTDEYATCKTLKADTPLRSTPFQTDTKTIKVKKGEALDVVGKYTKSSINYWYRVNYKGKYYYVYKDNVSELMAKPNPVLGSDATAPTGKRTQGSKASFNLRGTVTSYKNNIEAIKIGVIKDGNWLNGFAVQKYPNSKTFNIASIDYDIKFSKLPVGKYEYGIYARAVGGENRWLYRGDFEIVASGGSSSQNYISTGTASPIYKKGIYKVTDGPLNFRSGAGTNYYAYTLLSNGTQLEVTEVSANGWGKCTYGGRTGWISLDCTTFVRAIEEIKKPNAPKMMSIGKLDVAVGSKVDVTWETTSNTDSYTLRVYDSTDTEIESKKLTGIKGSGLTATAQVLLDNAGSYYFTVEAVNKKYTSDKSAKSGEFVAHDPVNVRFLDWEGKLIETKNVAYGTSAVAPTPPPRTGYTFAGWDKEIVNLTADTDVNATYTKNKYTVKFYNTAEDRANGKYIGEIQKVYFEDAAVAPAYSAPEGYKFVGWDKSFDCVTENMNITAVYEWYNPDFSVYISENEADTFAVRNTKNTGYNVSFKLINNGEKDSNCRIVVAIKTSQEKLVTTTESSAYYLSANEEISDTIFVPTTEAAAIVEVYAVSEFANTVPICKSVRANVNLNNSWTGWQTTEAPDDALDVETKTEYRYRNKQYSTESFSNKPGWTLYNTTSEWGEYGEWSNWTTTPIEASDSRQVETKTESKTSTVSYNMVTYNTQNYNGGREFRRYSVNGNYSGNGLNSSYGEHVRRRENVSQSELNNAIKVANGAYTSSCTYAGTNKSGTTGYILSLWGEKYVFFIEKENKQTTNTTYYRYRDRELINKYDFWQWGDYSDWSTTKVEANAERDVETRTVYRYIPNDAANIENNSGTQVTIPITGYEQYAGKEAYLFVYKINEASDFTNEYIGQATIDDNGECSFTFIPREEPSTVTGDYTVMLGIEGTTDTILIETDQLKAPVPTYKVRFVDDDAEGTLIKEVEVKEGEYAESPSTIPEKEGHTFIGWEYIPANVQSDITVKAKYQKNQYAVVFIDWEKQTFETQTYYYGDPLTPPDIEDTDDSYVIGWDGVTEGMVVTNNMVITANYEKKTHKVTFYDWDGNIISEQTIEHGEYAEVPTLADEENRVFLDWESQLDYNNVTEDITVVPKYAFSETTPDPVADVVSGLYTENQTITLSCEDENAVIYYTTDGSEPAVGSLEYTKPLVFNSSVELRFIACSMGKNDSDIVTEYYAINSEDSLSKWMTLDELPDYVKSNLADYGVISSTGYRYKDVITTESLAEVLTLQNAEWTLSEEKYGEFSEWSKTEPEYSADKVYDVESKAAGTEQRTFYEYNRFKYFDEESQKYVYTYQEIADVEGEWETLSVESALTISAFDGTNPVYSLNNEKWFNQTQTTKEVEVDYLLYRYRVKNYTYYKWTEWVTTESEGDTRECETGMVFRYLAPKRYIVNIVPTQDFLGNENKVLLALGGKALGIDSAEYEREGYQFLGFYTDSEYQNVWNLETDTVEENLTLYPKYVPNTYSVVFKGFDGAILSEQTVEHGGVALVPEAEEIEGYVFDGWDSTIFEAVYDNSVINAIYIPEDEYLTVKLNYSNFEMTAGTTAKLEATVTPYDEELGGVSWYSSDKEVVSVNDAGEIIAHKSGVATIYAIVDGSSSCDACEVTVTANPALELCLKESAVLGIDSEGQLREIKVDANTVEFIVSQFKNSKLTVIDRKGNVLSNDGLVGTGAKIQLVNNGNVLDEIVVVMTGDMNGDGYINNRDASMITRYLVAKETADLSQLTAIDVNGDGYINNRDAAMVSRYLVGKETI